MTTQEPSAATATARQIIHDSLCPCATDISKLYCGAPPGRIDEAIAGLYTAGLMAPVPAPERESFTEWGVRWYDGQKQVELAAYTEDEARAFVAAAPGSSVVCRTVTRSPWREVTDA